MIKGWVMSNKLKLFIFAILVVLDFVLFIKFDEWLAISNSLIIFLYLYTDYKHYEYVVKISLDDLNDITKDLQKTLTNLFGIGKKDDEDDDKKD